MDDNLSIASSIISDVKVSKPCDYGRTSSLNNLLPKNDGCSIDMRVSSDFIHTEHVDISNQSDHTNCETSCTSTNCKSEKVQSQEAWILKGIEISAEGLIKEDMREEQVNAQENSAC